MSRRPQTIPQLLGVQQPPSQGPSKQAFSRQQLPALTTEPGSEKRFIGHQSGPVQESGFVTKGPISSTEAKPSMAKQGH